jgi:hypothetical protein
MGEPVQRGDGQPEQVLATIGDIAITQHWLLTPAGTFPIRGTVWTVTDMSHWQERMAPLGIILAILFIWLCFLSLFFLLMKERTVTGYIQVSVQGNGFHHSTLIPATQHSIPSAQQMVNYSRSLAAVA